MVAITAAISADSLCYPVGVAVDGAGNLYVADDGNSRVLEYNTPLTTDTTADTVFGQGGNFTSDDCDNGGFSANSLCYPDGVAVDGAGNLYVADTDNSRVLEYNTPLTNTTADTVFGQGGSFTESDCNTDTGYDSNPTDNDLCYPDGSRGGRGGQPLRGGYRQQPGAGVRPAADGPRRPRRRRYRPRATATATETATPTATTTATPTATTTATADADGSAGNAQDRAEVAQVSRRPRSERRANRKR